MKLKTNPIRWWAQVILVGLGLILSIYALISGYSPSDWFPKLVIFILLSLTIECPVFSSDSENMESSQK